MRLKEFSNQNQPVIAGLDPAIQELTFWMRVPATLDARVKPGHDKLFGL
jgi:hypothetical protein